MFGRNKKQPAAPAAVEPEVPTEPPTPLPDVRIRLYAEWDDEKAAWHYCLQRVLHDDRHFHGMYLSPAPEPVAGKWHWCSTKESDDEAWAKRQAEHYSLEIIYEEVKK